MKISVIIPVKNGEDTLVKCLTAIRQQTIAREMEIIVLDSMSTDNSRKIAESHAATIIDIPNGTFNHGLTRNVGIEHAKGELLYFTVQDAYLAEDNQLERMAAHFTDSEIQSVTGIQAIPSDPDKNPAIWFKRFSQPVPEVKQFAAGSFKNLQPKQQLENCQWDDVNAMYRRSALQALPFQKTDFAEDALWARDALMLGWKIIRDGSLVVYHYHHQSLRYNFKTTFIINYTIWKHFNVMPAVPFSLIPFIKNVYTLLKRKQLSFFKKAGWIRHNASRHLTKFLSVLTFRVVYLIGRDTLLNKMYHYLSSVVPQGALQKNNKVNKAYTLTSRYDQ